MNRKRYIHCLLLVPLILTAFSAGQVGAFSDMPDAAVKAPRLVPERSVSTLIASDVAPGGLAVNIIYPEKTRYADGAPVAVLIPGGDSPDGLGFSAHTAQCGFAEVRFAFPGGGSKGLASSGIYDYRGAESQIALRDILLFAAGKAPDTQGRHIADIVPVKLTKNNLGVIGWSNGGNIALATMGKYADQLPFISWLAFYESPIGSMFFPPNLGGNHDLVINRHYREGSCATGSCQVDYRRLAYQADGNRSADEHKKRGEPILPGIVYLDDNRNGKWDESAEFAFSYALDVGLDKQIYPPDVTEAMERMKIFEKWEEDLGPMKRPKDAKGKVIPDPADDNLTGKELAKKRRAQTVAHRVWAQELRQQWLKTNPKDWRVTEDLHVMRRVLKWPDNVASLEESEAFFRERDGSLFIEPVCSKYPSLLIGMFGSQIDHLQRQTDHPHIAFLYNAFLANKAHWVRLNPDPLYVGAMATMNQGNFVNNKANAPIDAAAIASQLEPEGLIPDYLFMDATAAELADRVKSKNLRTLDDVLLDYSYGAGPAPKVAE